MNNTNPQHVFRFCPRCGSSNFTPFDNKAHRCEQCRFELYTNASGAVVAIIRNEQNEILFTRRAFNPGKGTLDLPGGFIDPGETAEEALVREIYEELNLHISKAVYKGSFANEYMYSGLSVFTVDLVFECEVQDFSTLQVADDVSSYEFHHATPHIVEQIKLHSIRNIVKREYSNIPTVS
ncbi:MAG: NUDIX domain-containing protein [Bacteroidales bacterium]|jgi:mutator protein MutT|nr:NUDIX domain-containing protein [Bacteroidales bacterium]